ERTAFLAREDKRIDRRSGVSQRMPITMMETAVSNAERRAVITGEEVIVPRVADVYAALPAITGKVELEYEGELQGADRIARDLIAAAARDLFDQYWDPDLLGEVIDYFDRGGVLQISDTAGAEVCWKALVAVPGLEDAYRESALYPQESRAADVAAVELILEGLAAHRRISRADSGVFTRARQERRGKGGSSNFPYGLDLE